MSGHSLQMPLRGSVQVLSPEASIIAPSQNRWRRHSKRAMAMLWLAAAGVAQASEIQLAIDGAPTGGQLLVALCDEARFLRPAAGACAVERAVSLPLSGAVRLQPPAAGRYAITVIHDRNGNGRLDTNFLGIPREAVAVSRNPPPRRGPPRFADAAFDYQPSAPLQFSIRLATVDAD